MKKAPNGRTSAQNLTRYYPWLVFAVAFIVFLNTTGNLYNLDDELVTRNHPLTSQGIKAIPEIISSPYYSSGQTAYEYRPVVLISFAIEQTLFGENPHTSHFINVLLYAFTILLLYKTLHRLFTGYNALVPLLITLLFAVHPLHTEVVASIKNRDELLAFFFVLLSWVWAIGFIKHQGYKSGVLSVTAFSLAVLSKTSALPFAFIIPLSISVFDSFSENKFLLLTLFYAIIAGFIAPFFNFAHKVLFTVMVFALPYLSHLLLHTKLSDLSQLKKNIVGKFSHSNQTSDGYKWASVAIWLIVISSLFLGFTGVFYNFRLLIFMPLIGLLIIYFISHNTGKPYFFTTFISLVSLVSLNYTQSHIVAFCLVLILFIYFFAPKHKLTYLYVSLALLLAPWLWWARAEGLFWIVYLSFIMWLMSVPSRRKWGIILLAVFFISSPVISYIRGLSLFNSGFLYSMTAMGLALLLYFRFKRYRLALLMLFLIIPLALAVKLSTMTGSYSVLVKNYFNPATVVNLGADVLPASGRTLDLVEMPLDARAPLSLKAGTALYITAEYLIKLFFPLHMGFYYGYKHVEPQQWYHIQSLFSLLIHILLAVFALYMYKRNKLFLFGFLSYVAAISMFSNLVMPVPGLMADRFAYMPSLGFVIMLSALLFLLFRLNTNDTKIKLSTHKYLWITAFVILTLWSVRSIVRNTNWKDHLTLFRHDIPYLSQSAQAQNLLAAQLMNYAAAEKTAGKAIQMKQEAVTHFRNAIGVYPDFFNANYDLGRAYYELKNYDSALVYLQKASVLHPDFYDAPLRMAYIFHQTNSLIQAVEYYNKALELKADIPNAYKNLSIIYFGFNEPEKVIPVNHAYRAYAPDPKEPLINMARAFYQIQNTDSAAFYFEEILKLDPRDTDAMKALVEIYTNTDQTDKAAFYINALNSSER